MNKKDLASIRRRFSPEKNDISIIRGCFVNLFRRAAFAAVCPQNHEQDENGIFYGFYDVSAMHLPIIKLSWNQ